MENGIPIYSINQVNQYIKYILENDQNLRDIYVRGEISNFVSHRSGHMYLTLKEQKSVIKAVMFKGDNRSLKFNPKNGDKVIVRVGISVYEPSGQYQVVIKEMQQDGKGNLHLEFEKLKAKLAEEGLFSEGNKQPIPTLPKTIAVVTSPTGAAIRDILTTLKRRYPIAKIIMLPVLVQGEKAPKSIIKAIELMNRYEKIDVAIVGRGGGSIEDLWAFNDEGVARAISNSKIPIISAVGHETDFTISDFVADLRAPTPTGASELATPLTTLDLKKKIEDLKYDFKKELLYRLDNARERHDRVKKSLLHKHPKKELETTYQKLDQLISRIDYTFKNVYKHKRNDFEQLNKRLHLAIPREKINNEKKELQVLQKELQQKMELIMKEKTNELNKSIDKLDALSPLKVLKRGFSVTYKDDEVVKDIKQVKKGDNIEVKVVNGHLTCEVKNIEGETK